MADSSQVVVVGAGPTGLALALWLARAGVRVRIIDQTAEPGTTSRALVVHARTLELYRQLGIAGDVVARALPFTSLNLWAGGRRAAHVELGAIGRDLTPFPEMLIFPQDQHERLLIDHLARAGIHVERRAELVGLERRQNEVLARIRREDGAETVESCAFLAGCDGARSTVRHRLDVGFPGGTYERAFFVADVILRGPASDPEVNELHLVLDDADFVGLFPLAGTGSARLIGAVRPEALGHGDPTWQDVGVRSLDRLGLRVDRVNWFSTYRVHHRVAAQFRVGRVFLVGDAAHVHSPVGGQGMNTGVGDAFNLAWKLVDILRGRAREPEALLDSYETERIGFARRLVASTDRAFTLVSRNGWLARWMRLGVVPAVLPHLARGQRMRRFFFRTISQTAITYRSSPISSGRAGSVHGGDRLPWVAADDNFAPLTALDWQLHVYGQASARVRRVAQRAGLALHELPFVPDADRAGLARDAVYLVRPDGYIAVADGNDGGELESYLERNRA